MIRNWLRSRLGWDEFVKQSAQTINEAVDERVKVVETELAKQELLHATEIAELRERLEMPAKRKPSGRPFAVLAKIAEMGAQKQNAG